MLHQKANVCVGSNVAICKGLEVEKRYFMGTGFTKDAFRAGEFYLEQYASGTGAREIFDILR